MGHPYFYNKISYLFIRQNGIRKIFFGESIHIFPAKRDSANWDSANRDNTDFDMRVLCIHSFIEFIRHNEYAINYNKNYKLLNKILKYIQELNEWEKRVFVFATDYHFLFEWMSFGNQIEKKWSLPSH